MSDPNEHLLALDAVADALGEATAAKDWERIKQLDLSARTHMEAASDAAKSDRVPVADVMRRLDRLKQLFECARAEAVISRDAAAAELKATGRTHQAAQAYLKQSNK